MLLNRLPCGHPKGFAQSVHYVRFRGVAKTWYLNLIGCRRKTTGQRGIFTMHLEADSAYLSAWQRQQSPCCSKGLHLGNFAVKRWDQFFIVNVSVGATSILVMKYGANLTRKIVSPDKDRIFEHYVIIMTFLLMSSRLTKLENEACGDCLEYIAARCL